MYHPNIVSLPMLCTYFCLFNYDIGHIVVGYSQTVYTATEGEGMIELCATISTPSNGIAPRPFLLLFSTSDGTAGT